ncbi:MAG: hypothetical protein RL637_717 [Pseudomonadota bacterium]
MLSPVNIVLVETSHPGNIGAVARAMKNMGISQLRLVNPKQFPCAEATARASGADDLLAQARIFSDLATAISDCTWVIGATARLRTVPVPEISPRNCAQQYATLTTPIALVFGRENSGLTNQELDLCHYLLKIPCNPTYSSLNIAAAVQIVCYEFWLASQEIPANATGRDQTLPPLATAAQMEGFYQHLQQTIEVIGFLQPERAESMMRRLRRIFNRTHLDSHELDILRGILRFAQHHSLKP